MFLEGGDDEGVLLEVFVGFVGESDEVEEGGADAVPDFLLDVFGDLGSGDVADLFVDHVKHQLAPVLLLHVEQVRDGDVVEQQVPLDLVQLHLHRLHLVQQGTVQVVQRLVVARTQHQKVHVVLVHTPPRYTTAEVQLT